MKLILNSLNGKTLTVEKNNTDTILSITELISTSWNVEMHSIKLVLGSIVLDKSKRINDYSLIDNTSINVVISNFVQDVIVIIKEISNNQISIPMKSNQTIQDLKQKLFDIIKVPIEQQKLFFKNTLLGSEKTISFYNIQSNDVVLAGFRFEYKGTEIKTNETKLSTNEIFVKLQTINNQIEIVIPNSATIFDMKKMVFELYGFPITRQMYFLSQIKNYITSTLPLNNDNLRLIDYGITNNTQINTVFGK